MFGKVQQVAGVLLIVGGSFMVGEVVGMLVAGVALVVFGALSEAGR